MRENEWTVARAAGQLSSRPLGGSPRAPVAMKHLIVLALTFAPVPGFSRGSPPHSDPCLDGVQARAVYLVSAQPGISREELARYPEVCVVAGFEQLQSATGSLVAIWIDQGVARQVDVAWLQQPPQRYYPVMLVGYGTALYAFREQLGLPIEGPAVDWSLEPPKPGFSVGMITDETAESLSAVMQGYEETPSADRLLEITEELLGRDPGRRTPAGAEAG